VRFIEIFMSIFLLCSYANAQNIFDEVESTKDDAYGAVESVEKRQQEEDAELEDLRELEKFADIAVIQKKYLDKSGRFEMWAGGSLALNSQFYDFLGLNFALTYHLNETWGIELEGLILTDLQKNITQNLEEDQNIVTRSIVVPSNYFGAHIRWSPIYGKMSLREKTINPFEMYFTLGGGVSGIDDGQTVPTIHLGTGQVYPLSKNTTFRWALSYNFFQADARSDLQGSISGESVNTGFLYLSAGVSVFLPFSKSR
jgi:outer membrane beta-barrel protein